MAEEKIDYEKLNADLQADIETRLKDITIGIERLKTTNARMTRAGRALIDAYGGDVPDWLEEEFSELEDAMEEAEAGS